ncbi:MAG: transporter permease [Clostridiaceae bacterium]|nr:transporter permease [Clostridiaceae bacterium]
MSKGVHTVMKINTFKFFISDSLKGLKRNRTVSIAAAATVAATLFILGVFVLAILNINQGVKDVESKVEAKVYLNNDITMAQKNDLENKLKNSDGVTEVTFESKAQAMEKFKQQLGSENKGLVDGLEKDNPMPNSYTVKVKEPAMLSGVVAGIKDMPGIETIKDGREVVDKLVKITNGIKWIGIALFIILIGVSLFLIGNTIKITVYSRRREIGIMKFIGATDWFIRWPFLMEGMVIGFIGSLASAVLLYYSYRALFLKLSNSFIAMQMVQPGYILTNVLGLFIITGVIIGALGSILSIRKFLAV